jgi:hypothetical protein
MRSGRIGHCVAGGGLGVGGLVVDPVLGDLGAQGVVLAAFGIQALGGLVEHAQGVLQVGDDSDLARIVAADLVGIDVDVNQLGGREVEGVAGLPRAAVGLLEAGAQAQDVVGGQAAVVDVLGAPEAGHAQGHRMVVGQGALAHQRVGDGQAEVLDQLRQLLRRVGQQDAAADIEQGLLGAGQGQQDAVGGLVVDRGLLQHLGVGLEAIEQGDLDLHREDVHRHRDQHRAGPAAGGQLEGLLQDLGEQVGALHPPGALDERAVDLELRGVGVEVDLLVRMLAVIVAGNVAGDHHHRDGVQRRVGHAGRGVGQAGAEVAEHHGGLLLDPRIAVGGVRGDLLVTHIDELDRAVGQGGQHGDVGVAAQAEQVADAPVLEVFHQLVGDQVFHGELHSPRDRGENLNGY